MRESLPADAAAELLERGFVVLTNVITADRLERLSAAYDAGMSSASEPDVRHGSTTTRVNDFVNRGDAIDAARA